VAPLGPAEEALLLELNLVGHALRVGGASVALLSTAAAPQLVLDLTPNGHGPRLVNHLLGLNLVGCALRVGGASVVPPGPAAARVGFYEKLYCYGFESSYIFKDSIIKTGRQLGTVSFKRKNGKIETLSIYFKPKSQDTKSIITIDNVAYDFNIFYGF
jgi:hypothetical protein